MTRLLSQRFRNFKRLQHILAVLVRHGFGDIVTRLKLDVAAASTKRALLFRRARKAQLRQTVEERIRQACAELGPTFVKLGQMLATRPDLIPESLALELRKLQDDVPPFAVTQLKAVIEEDLGRPLTDIFGRFDEQPLAAASVAQVHAAELPDGRAVVVKVQRPSVRETVETDLSILSGLAEQLEERIAEIRRFRPVALIGEFSRALHREMDFRNEVYAMQRFARQFAESPLVAVPKPFPELCSARVIVMERMSGCKISDREALQAAGLEPLDIARRGTQVVLQSIFEHGFFHADPHPGNFFIRNDGVLCVLDFGLMGHVDAQRIDELLTFLVSLLIQDMDMLVQLLQDAELVPDTVDERTLKRDLSLLVDRYLGAALQDLDVATLVLEVMEVMRRFDVHLPTDLVLVGKAVGTMEGIAKALCPTFRPLDEIRPYLISVYVKHSLDPRQHSRQIARTLSEVVSLLRFLPRDVRGILRKANRGELQVRVADADSEKAVRQRDRAVNRIVATIVFCLVAVLSTALLYYPPAGAGAGVTVAGVFGYFVAFLTGLLLLWSVYRSSGL